MNVCIYTNHFFPEDFKVNDIAFELAERGHKVTVITAIPDYPKGQYYEGYSLFLKRKEVLKNVNVIRLFRIPRGKGSKLNLMLNYLSYFISASIHTFFFSFRTKFDVVFVHETSPFFIGIPAVFLSKLKKIPLCFWVLDLWPESIQSTVGINNKLIIDLLNRVVRYVYKNCNNILISSKGFRKSILTKGPYDEKIIYFPNWAEDIKYDEGLIDIKSIYPFSVFKDTDFKILFTGNIGEAQGLDIIIDAAYELREINHIKWIFLGDGRYKTHLMEKVIQKNLEHTVFFLGRYPLATMPNFMASADMLLVSLKDNILFELTVPAKVQFYMSQGKPILALLKGDGAELIKEAKCGISIDPGDVTSLVKIVKKIVSDRPYLISMGENGREYYKDYFEKADRIKDLEDILQQEIENKSNM